MDTVKLQIKINHLNDILHDNFFFKDIKRTPDGRSVYTNVAWAKNRRKMGIYTPKYGIHEDYNNYDSKYFVVEFSVPKLIFGENITELNNSHLHDVVEKLQLFFEKINLTVLKQQILLAKPEIVAIGKNIALTNLCSVDSAIQILSKFDYKPHSEFRIANFPDHKAGGREIHFNIKKTETIKFYDKKCELINNAKLSKEIKLSNDLKNKNCIVEILRFECTYKTSRKVMTKFKKYIDGREITFQSIFDKNIWEDLLKNEIEKIYCHPLKSFILLSDEQEPYIKGILDKYFKQIQTKNNIRGLMSDLQEYGYAKTRQNFLSNYKSRTTWYNYLKKIKCISDKLDYRSLCKLESFKVYSYILRKFNVETKHQPALNIVYKKTDT